MKLLLSSLAAAVLGGVLFFTAAPVSLTAQNQLVDPRAPIQPVPQVQSPDNRIEQYRVIDISTIPMTNARGGAAGTLEAVLNEQASQGWRVRETSGSFLILAR